MHAIIDDCAHEPTITHGSYARAALERAPQGRRITIDDEGPGIAKANIPNVFEPFRRLETSRNRGTGSVGHGVTIARQAIEREGGSIRLLSRPGRGLRAEVRLPAHRDRRRAATPGALT